MGKYAKCSHCGTEFDIGGYFYNYFYPQLTHYSRYPKIKVGWCSECKEFVDVQMGINYSDIYNEGKRINEELNSLSKKWIKTNSVKEKIRMLSKEQFECNVILEMLNGRDSLCSCTKCGGINISIKDLEKHPTVCPKCNIGILEVETRKDDILFRLGDKVLSPVFPNGDLYVDMMQVYNCANAMFFNEYYYWRSIGQKAKFYNIENYACSMINRNAYVFALLLKHKKIRFNRSEIADVFYKYFWKDATADDDKEKFNKMFSFDLKFYDDELYVKIKANTSCLVK